MRPPANVVDFLVHSLEGEAPGWEFGRHMAEHADLRAEVWVANQHYGLHVRVGGVRYCDGINIFGFLVPWRRRLYRACMEAAERRVLAMLNAYHGPADVAAVEQAGRARL